MRKTLLFAEVHNVPNDYHFTDAELDCIIAGDMFTNRQGAIMARELLERRKAERDSEPVTEVIQKLNGYDRPLYVVAIQGDVEVGDVLYRHAEQPVVTDGYVLVPKKLTAGNGAKGLLSGEFSETKFITCPECFGDDDCETCDGSGRIEITVPVTWTTIKAIWAKGVEHFAAAQKKQGNSGNG